MRGHRVIIPQGKVAWLHKIRLINVMESNSDIVTLILTIIKTHLLELLVVGLLLDVHGTACSGWPWIT